MTFPAGLCFVVFSLISVEPLPWSQYSVPPVISTLQSVPQSWAIVVSRSLILALKLATEVQFTCPIVLQLFLLTVILLFVARSMLRTTLSLFQALLKLGPLTTVPDACGSTSPNMLTGGI